MKDFDGINHINIYSKSKSKLGRYLSHFSEFGFDIANDHFKTLEGYFYFVLLKYYFKKFNYKVPKKVKEFLMTSKGVEIKKTMQDFFKINKIQNKDLNKIKSSKEFQNEILKGIEARLLQNKILIEELQKNSLPFEHYYVFGDKIIDKKDEFQYIINFYENFKKENL